MQPPSSRRGTRSAPPRCCSCRAARSQGRKACGGVLRCRSWCSAQCHLYVCMPAGVASTPTLPLLLLYSPTHLSGGALERDSVAGRGRCGPRHAPALRSRRYRGDLPAAACRLAAALVAVARHRRRLRDARLPAPGGCRAGGAPGRARRKERCSSFHAVILRSRPYSSIIMSRRVAQTGEASTTGDRRGNTRPNRYARFELLFSQQRPEATARWVVGCGRVAATIADFQQTVHAIKLRCGRCCSPASL